MGLEHQRNPRLAIQEMHRVLRPGGTLVITTYFMHVLHNQTGKVDNNDYFRFTLSGLKMLVGPFGSIQLCGGWSDPRFQQKVFKEGFAPSEKRYSPKTFGLRPALKKIRKSWVDPRTDEHHLTVWIVVKKGRHEERGGRRSAAKPR